MKVGVACLFLGLFFGMSSCTSINVDPLPSGITDVAICENPKVQVSGFLNLLESAFRDHSIRTKVFREEDAPDSGYVVSYTARRSWDLATYLSEAEIWVRRDGDQVAYANYHLIGKGGLSLAKWAGIETKMAPVFEELFVNYPKSAASPPQQ